MTTPPSLKGSQLRTYEKIFEQPPAHNLDWREMRTMLAHLSEVTEQANGHLMIVRNGHTLHLHRPHAKEFTDAKELKGLRHFLEQSETPLPPADPHGAVLVVISHHEARVFHPEAAGAAVQTVRPHRARSLGHAEDSEQSARGKERPAPEIYFEPLAAVLKDAGKILLFGCGTGHSSEMEVFGAWLKTHHAGLAARIVGQLVVDEHHQSDGELLAKARELLKHPKP